MRRIQCRLLRVKEITDITSKKGSLYNHKSNASFHTPNVNTF
jgi:hypothetical protein